MFFVYVRRPCPPPQGCRPSPRCQQSGYTPWGTAAARELAAGSSARAATTSRRGGSGEFDALPAVCADAAPMPDMDAAQRCTLPLFILLRLLAKCPVVSVSLAVYMSHFELGVRGREVQASAWWLRCVAGGVAAGGPVHTSGRSRALNETPNVL